MLLSKSEWEMRRWLESKHLVLNHNICKQCEAVKLCIDLSVVDESPNETAVERDRRAVLEFLNDPENLQLGPLKYRKEKK